MKLITLLLFVCISLGAMAQSKTALPTENHDVPKPQSLQGGAMISDYEMLLLENETLRMEVVQLRISQAAEKSMRQLIEKDDADRKNLLGKISSQNPDHRWNEQKGVFEAAPNKAEVSSPVKTPAK
jgi:hypothetical protein